MSTSPRRSFFSMQCVYLFIRYFKVYHHFFKNASPFLMVFVEISIKGAYVLDL